VRGSADAIGHPSQQVSNENKGQAGLGSDSEENVVEATASKPDRGEALDADVVGSAAVATQADQFSGDLELAMRESAAAATAQALHCFARCVLCVFVCVCLCACVYACIRVCMRPSLGHISPKKVWRTCWFWPLPTPRHAAMNA
jgi:hypothetical protein